jgi:hypothetical protein
VPGAGDVGGGRVERGDFLRRLSEASRMRDYVEASFERIENA